MADTRPIYEGPLGNTSYKISILPIGENMNRGNLHILNSEDVSLYQREVSVTRREPFGGTKANMAEWQKVINSWLHNNS